MTQQSGDHLDTKEIARKIEQLVNQTPPEVMERMKKRLEQRRHLQAGTNSGELMNKRTG